MPREIPVAALNKIAQTTGLEPVNVIRVQWVRGGGYSYYADRAVQGSANVQGKLISLDDVEAVLNIEKSGTSTSVKIKLTDVDGSIKKIFDYHDIHNRPVIVYQWFTDLPLTVMFPIFEGHIASPISWSEGDRSIGFDIMTKLEDREVGFSVEDGDFVDVPEILLGKAWPLVFGTVLDMPTLQMDEKPTGTTLIDLGIPDSNLKRQANYHKSKSEDQSGKAICISMRGAELMWTGTTTKDRAMFERGQGMQRQARDMLNSANANTLQAERFETIHSNQKGFDASVIPIINGHKFRQNENIEIEINGAHYKGVFHGDSFQVSSRQGPTEPTEKKPKETKAAPSSQIIIEDPQELTDSKIANMLFGGIDIFSPTLGASGTGSFGTGGSVGNEPNPALSTSKTDTDAYWACEPPYFIAGGSSVPEEDTVGEQREHDFFFAAKGSGVSIGNNYPIRYILSVTPGTQVLWLSAKRSVAGLKQLVQIPPNYYYISTMMLGSVSAIIATFPRPLSSMKTDNNDQDWEDDIFATLQSPIGPNVVNIMIWLIQTYTENTIDFVSFNYVRNRVESYPANFAILEKKNVVDLLKEIAWQSRCAIWIADGRFYLKYLPEQSTPIDTITENDIDQRSLEVSTTPSEDLVTKMIATWKPNYSQEKPDKIIFRYNINKYGTRERTYDFYIYNAPELVVKSATFWMIRLANMWKIMKCKTMLTKLKIETLDNVIINLAHPFFANVAVVGTVEKATFSSTNFEIDMEIWLPVRIGEMVPYLFAYPANIGIQYIWPTKEDIAGGFTGDTPQQIGATGSLGSKSANTITAPKSKGFGSHTASTHPSDGFDSPQTNNLPPIQTTLGGSPYVGRVAEGTPASTANPRESRPSYDYTFRNSPPILITPERPTGGQTYIGQINEKVSGKTYKGTIYPQGSTKPGITVDKVTVPDISDTDTIPSGSWGYIVKQLENDGTSVTVAYYFQPAVWFSGSTSEGDGGGDSPGDGDAEDFDGDAEGEESDGTE